MIFAALLGIALATEPGGEPAAAGSVGVEPAGAVGVEPAADGLELAAAGVEPAEEASELAPDRGPEAERPAIAWDVPVWYRPPRQRARGLSVLGGVAVGVLAVGAGVALALPLGWAGAALEVPRR